MAKLLIKSAAVHGGDQYGTTMHNSKPALSFPKTQTADVVAGKATKAKAPIGGTQYGTTIQDSKPYRQFPNANLKMNQNRVPQPGSRVYVDSHKVIQSVYRDGIQIAKLNGATKKTASMSGSGMATDRPYPLATRYGKKGPKDDVTPKNFQDM